MSARPTIMAALAILLAASHAQANTPPSCFQRDVLVKTLSTKYGEALTGGGLQNQQQAIEVWSSAKTGSFTIFVSQANGVSCVVATGQNWINATPAVEGVAG